MLPYAQSNDQTFTLTHKKMFWIQACHTIWTGMRKGKKLCVLHGNVEFSLHYEHEERKK